jgi:Family of unknown function (DUF5343)
MANLPYVTATGNIDRALRGIKAAQTPERVSQDFVKTILKITGGSGDQITAYLRKVGFANPDGTPTALYGKFRNAATEGQAAAEAIRFGYKPLYVRNEYMHQLDDQALRGLIIEETGASEASSVADLVLACIKSLKKYARWDSAPSSEIPATAQLPAATSPSGNLDRPTHGAEQRGSRQLQMNLGYTINLNLPATTDAAVFSAIFKSLKEHLLKDSDE